MKKLLLAIMLIGSMNSLIVASQQNKLTFAQKTEHAIQKYLDDEKFDLDFSQPLMNELGRLNNEVFGGYNMPHIDVTKRLLQDYIQKKWKKIQEYFFSGSFTINSGYSLKNEVVRLSLEVFGDEKKQHIYFATNLLILYIKREGLPFNIVDKYKPLLSKEVPRTVSVTIVVINGETTEHYERWRQKQKDLSC